MPDEIVGGDTTEGAVPLNDGDTAGSTTDEAVISPEAGTAPEASAPVELPEALRDKYVPVDRYQHLESKLGNWSETEKNAALYQQLSQDPRVLAALQPQAEPQQSEEIPDFSGKSPAEVMEYLDKRSEERAQRVFDAKMAEFKAQNIDPMAKDVYTRQADDMVKSMEAKYPDFKENREAIAEFLDQNPALAENLNEKSLDMAYRYVTWEKQQQAGAKAAVVKLQTKSKETATKPQGSAPSGKAKPQSIADAWAQAEESNI